MTPNHEVGLYIFILAGFLGYHVISRVPPLLHTPLMSATNAMSGISLVGSLVVAGSGHGFLSTALGFIAVACSSTNVVGGFLITDRMLKMFKKEEDPVRRRQRLQFELSVLGGLGLFLAEFGMLLAVVGTLFHEQIIEWHWIGLGLLIGSVIGGGMGLWVPMT